MAKIRQFLNEAHKVVELEFLEEETQKSQWFKQQLDTVLYIFLN